MVSREKNKKCESRRDQRRWETNMSTEDSNGIGSCVSIDMTKWVCLVGTHPISTLSPSADWLLVFFSFSFLPWEQRVIRGRPILFVQSYGATNNRRAEESFVKNSTNNSVGWYWQDEENRLRRMNIELAWKPFLFISWERKKISSGSITSVFHFCFACLVSEEININGVYMCLFVSMGIPRSTNGFQVCVVYAHLLLSSLFLLLLLLFSFWMLRCIRVSTYLFRYNWKCTRTIKRVSEKGRQGRANVKKKRRFHSSHECVCRCLSCCNHVFNRQANPCVARKHWNHGVDQWGLVDESDAIRGERSSNWWSMLWF